MIPLDAVAIFPNIPLELVKKAFPNRWIKVKSHTKSDEKEFLKGLYFIMNSTVTSVSRQRNFSKNS